MAKFLYIACKKQQKMFSTVNVVAVVNCVKKHRKNPTYIIIVFFCGMMTSFVCVRGLRSTISY